MDSFLRGIDLSETESLEITGNNRWISIHPAVLSLVAALGLPIDPDKVSYKHPTAASAHYLERMGLFDFLGVQSGMKIEHHESAGRFIPLTQIRSSSELSDFIKEMVPLLHVDPHHADSIKYVVSELVRNVLEHSRSDIGAIVCAQYYPKSNRIRIGIADTGVGIKRSIEGHHPAYSHEQAIRLALTPGITGTTSKEGGTELNAGAGLFFIKSMAKVNHDFFMIYSGDTMYKLLIKHKGKLFADPFKDRHSVNSDYPTFQGTLVGVDISLDSSQEFSQLLSLIRDIYVETVRERKKMRYKKRPRFI